MLDLLQPFTEGLEERDASSRTPAAGSDPAHEVVEEQSHDEKLPSVATDAGRDTLAEDTKSRKSIIGSQPRGNHNVFTHYPKGLNCEVCKKSKTTKTRTKRRGKPKKSVDGIAPSTKFGDLVTADHKILNVENESRCGRKDALIVQDELTNWIQSYPMKKQCLVCKDLFLRHRSWI